MANLCISIRGLKRANYLKRCLLSLENNLDLSGVDFYFLQDGAVNPFSNIRYAMDEEVEASLEVFKGSCLPNKRIYTSTWNMGCGLQKQHQLTTLFPKYEYVVLVDNDLVFNVHYIGTLKTLFHDYRNDEKAGILQTSFRHTGGNYQDHREAKRLENKVAYGFSHRWELGFWRSSWKKIEPLMEPYFSLIQRCDFIELLHNPDAYKETRKALNKEYGTVHADYAIEKCAIKAGYKGLHTLSLRHKTIGKEGLYSFSGERWEVQGFEDINLYRVGDVEKYELVE